MPLNPGFDLAVIGAGLAFAEAVPALVEALPGGAVVVEAPPGTGKTTLVPPVVANTVDGRVILVQPRRVAAAAAAGRLASLTGTRVGELVGVTVRGRREVSAATRIEVVTPGVLLRRLVADPELTGVGAVVLDEVHERGLETDLLVAMLAEVRSLREDLVLVAMSATLDTQAFADLLGARVVSAESVLHPLSIEWAPPRGAFADARGVTREFLAHVVDVTVRTWRGGDGDALVFVPGAGEVARVADLVAAALPEADVLPLHGRLSLAEQDRITAPSRGQRPRRVVVSTALAESSLTVPGVRLVIDAGLSREPRRDAARGMSGLVTVRCSRDAAVQRAGRAAREAPGRAVRCYDQATFAAMPEHVTPQVSVADLTGAALLLAAWGAPGGEGMALPTPLPPVALADAVAELTALGAVDDDGRITDLGRRIAAVPADPRLARALLADDVPRGTAAEVVALLADDLRPEGAALAPLLAAVRSGGHPASGRWRTEAARLRRIAGAAGEERDDAALGLVVATAHPARIARRRGDVYLFASGTRAALPQGSSLHGQEWLAVADVARAEGRAAADTGAVIRAAAPLSQEQALHAGAHLLSEIEFCALDNGRAVCRRVRSLGAIELAATPVPATPVTLRAMWADAVAEEGIAALGVSEAAERLRRRLAFLRRHVGEPWPDVSDEALLASLDSWFDPTVTRVADVDVAAGLRALLPWPEASRLEELAPERLTVADGSTARVDYPALDDPDARPVVAVRLQSCFGMKATPRLADGVVPVLFHLLSPARRPLAITDDLASFWAGPYAQVRAEMRGRYPKHPWPEDPAGAA